MICNENNLEKKNVIVKININIFVSNENAKRNLGLKSKLPYEILSRYPLATGHKIAKNIAAILVLSKTSGYIGADEKMVSSLLITELSVFE